MDRLRIYFSSAPDSHRVYLLGGALVLCWLIENLVPVFANYKKGKHSIVNALFILPDGIVQFALGALLAKEIFWTGNHHWGILYHIPGQSNTLFIFIATFVLLDLLEYVYHVTMHKAKTFWMFHVVHHSDTVCDASTVLREHPGETFIRLSFLLLWVFITGTCFWALIFRQFIQIESNVVVHSNFQLPSRLEKIVGTVFVTPTLHHVHHHYKQPYTDTNYGDVLIIWDRIFGTCTSLQMAETKAGIDSYPDTGETTNFAKLMLMPFGEYRARPDDIEEFESAEIAPEDASYASTI